MKVNIYKHHVKNYIVRNNIHSKHVTNSLQKTGPIVAFFLVAFSINAAIGISIAAFRKFYSDVLRQ